MVQQRSPGQQLEDAASIHGLLARPSPHGHIVQFYDDDQVLIEGIARFASTGVRCVQPIVLIASARRRAAITARLRLDGIDVERITMTGQLVAVDAVETLAAFMDGETPSWDRFRHTIGGLLERSAGGRGACVRAYGEMVDLLWQRGARAAAIQVEQFWNDIARLHTFSLLCGYAMGNFVRTSDAEALEHVCRAHGHIIPPEPYAILDADGRGHQLAVLQQRARALDAEIAARQALEVELAAALAREARSAELWARYHELLVGLLGHDLRNQLGAVMMNAGYIARLRLGDTPDRNASRITASAARMSRMIDQLLELTQIWLGGVALDPVALDLAALCRGVTDELEADHPAWSIVVETLGDPAGTWDVNGLVRVVSNLAGNAIAHGTGACQIALRIDGRAAAEVVVEVHNGGMIAPRLAASLFEPEAGNKQRHKADGLGLGLYLSKQIIVAHGGTIALHSNERDGTTVRVVLPRHPIARSASPAPGPAG
jgi:signal transduction histidine kinase